MNQLKKLSAASKIAIFYALIGGCWIFFSDWILAGLVKDERQLTFCQNYKGWGFVGITALSLYWILSCYLSQLKSSQLNGIKFSTLVESANDAIFLMKGDKFVDCNSKTIAIFGLKNKEDIIGKTPYFFSPERQPNGRLSKEKAGELISAVQKGIPKFFEWQHWKADQTPFYTEVSLNRLPPPHEELIIAIVRDITERKKAEEEIRKLNEELEHRVRIKTKELELKNRQLQENQQILLKLIKELNLKTEAIQQANSRLQELDRLKSMFI
ncbi:MAG: PAS domain S-box protein, partial [Desulfobacterota bacterium]|nr:PAS domain S-box protein [Thermodesulfobacteriota bacterium]